MAAIWISTDEETTTQPPRPQHLPFLSACCQDNLQMHWPCEEKAQCTKCGECAICGSNFEPEAMADYEQQRRRR